MTQDFFWQKLDNPLRRRVSGRTVAEQPLSCGAALWLKDPLYCEITHRWQGHWHAASVLGEQSHFYRAL